MNICARHAHRRRVVLPSLCTALLLTACGNDEQQTDTSGTRLPGGGPRPLEAAYVFKDGALAPARVTIPATETVILVVSAADGRPHGLVVQVGEARTRIVLRPGETARRQLQGLRGGTTYRLVPDGASDPVELRVG